MIKRFPQLIVIGDVVEPLADLGDNAKIELEEVGEDAYEDLVGKVAREEASRVIGAALLLLLLLLQQQVATVGRR